MTLFILKKVIKDFILQQSNRYWQNQEPKIIGLIKNLNKIFNKNLSNLSLL